MPILPTVSTSPLLCGLPMILLLLTSIQTDCGCQVCPLYLPYRGNYKNLQPYKSGRTCGDCPGACDNGLCSESLHFIILSATLIPRPEFQITSKHPSPLGTRAPRDHEPIKTRLLSVFLPLLQPIPVPTSTSTPTVTA